MTQDTSITQPGELQLPAEWSRRTGIEVLDPDGWRTGSPLGERPWDEPITYAEFSVRASHSTLGMPI